MQLLDSEQLEYAFALHGIDREAEARAFYTDLWDLIKSAETAIDRPAQNRAEIELRKMCSRYFGLMALWQKEEEELVDFDRASDLSLGNARQAQNLLPGFERQFFRYCLCYMDLNRALVQMKAKISRLAKDRNIDTADVLKVTNATGILLSQTHLRRMELLQKRLRLDRAHNLLLQTDSLMEHLGEKLPAHFGHDEGDRNLTRFKGALRKRQFSSARDIARGWNIKATQTALRIIDSIETHADDLAASEGIMLHSGELSLIRQFLSGDEERINHTLDKLNVPYMVFQYRNLLHQGYLLGKIGTLESLIIQHAKLAALAARPHNDASRARLQEQAILMPARTLLQGGFRTLGSIFDEMETIVSILEKLIAQTREYLAHTAVQ